MNEMDTRFANQYNICLLYTSAETFTVRRVAYGVGIERVFPINSPFVEKVTVVRKGKVRRAKLFYLRGRTGKAAKVKSDI